MGRLNVTVPDDLDKVFRKKIVDKFGSKQGNVSMAVIEAISLWIGEEE